MLCLFIHILHLSLLLGNDKFDKLKNIPHLISWKRQLQMKEINHERTNGGLGSSWKTLTKPNQQVRRQHLMLEEYDYIYKHYHKIHKHQ